MIWVVYRTVRARNILLIHARSYIPAAVGMVVGRITSVPFIFDMRALWPEELIVSGRLRRNSMLDRLIEIFERQCLRRSSAVVSLTYAAVGHVERISLSNTVKRKIHVIPTCADLERFVPAARDEPRDTLVLVPVHRIAISSQRYTFTA